MAEEISLAEKQADSTSEVGRFETEILRTQANLTALMNLSGEWIDKVQQRKPLKQLILDLDSSVSETYGEQEGTAYNGHFECSCYHPLFLFNQSGDLERAMLRRGNHASAKFWRWVLPRDVKHWSLTTLREKLVKIGAKVTRHSLLRDVSTGRSGCDAEVVCRDPRPHRAVGAAAAGRRWVRRVRA